MLFLVVFITCLFIVIYIVTDLKGAFCGTLMLGFILRLMLLVITCTDIVEIPDAHMDAEGFDETAKGNQGLSCSNWDSITGYTNFLTVVYSLTDSTRWFAQFLNLVFGMVLLFFVRKILFLLDIKNKCKRIVMGIMAFMPFLIIYSVVLMREAWVAMFIACSLYHFICWFLQKGNSVYRILCTIVCIILAMWMHAGVVGILIGYFIAFFTCNRKFNKISITSSSYVALFLGVFFLFLVIAFIDVFAAKFMTADASEYIQNKSNGEGGGSDYLTWLDLSSPSRMLFFSPLKMFYFLFSPIPIHWRGLTDIAAFFMDSIVYLYAIYFILFRKVGIDKYRLLKKYLIISLVATVFLFSFGTANSGTAIRHRAKICSVFLIVMAISDKKINNWTQKNKIITKSIP